MSQGEGSLHLEAEPIVTVQLDVYREDGSTDSYEEEFSLLAFVVQLKEDVEEQVGIPAGQQIWTYKDVQLDDHVTLLSYQIGSDEIIKVTTRGA